MKKCIKMTAFLMLLLVFIGGTAKAATDVSRGVGSFNFSYYKGDGRLVSYSGSVLKGNENIYFSESTNALSGARSGMYVFGTKAGKTTPYTEVKNPAVVGGTVHLNYTSAVGSSDYARIAGYDDANQTGGVSGNFTP